MEQTTSSIINWLKDDWWLVIWFLFIGSYTFNAAKGLFFSGKNQKLIEDLEVYKSEYFRLVDQHRRLVDVINSKGGDSFLFGESGQFTKKEVKTLIRLCHPDKHGGDKLANEITAKLLRLR